MRYIRVPKDVELLTVDGKSAGSSVSFSDWLKGHVLVDAKLGKTSKSLMAAADIGEKVSTMEDCLILSDAEWDLLQEVVIEPSNGYNTPVAIQLVSFLRAFLNAPDADSRGKLEAVGE